MRYLILIFTSILLLMLISCTKDDFPSGLNSSSEWLHYRGDNRNSGFTSGNIPTNGFLVPEWEYDHKVFLNKLIATKGRIFITRDSLRILDAKTGRIIYRNNTIQGCQPTISGDYIYFGHLDGTVSKFDFIKNELVWKIDIPNIPCTTPIIENNKILIIAEKQLYCITTSGELLWQTEIGTTLKANVAVSNGMCYIGTTAGVVFGINVESGAIKWSRSGLNPIKSIPVLINDKLVIGADGGQLYCLNTSDGNTLWTFSANNQLSFNMGGTDGTHIVYDTKASAVFNDSIYCIALNNGKLKWSKKSNGVNHETVLISGNKVLCHVDGIFSMLDINTGNKYWESNTYIYDTPILLEDRIIISLGRRVASVKL